MAGLLGINAEIFHPPMNYVLRSKAWLLFAAKHGPEDRLRVKLNMLEHGSDADLMTHNLSSVAVI